MKVRNMTSAKGNAVPNQFIITSGTTIIFQSYDTIVCRIVKGKVYLDKEKWDYSATTGKYRNQFLMERIAETREKIRLGIYKLTDLNK